MHTSTKTLWPALLALEIGWLGCVAAFAPAVADADAEREALARIAHELEALSPLLQEAESQANPDARIRFRYDWLRQDLVAPQNSSVCEISNLSARSMDRPGIPGEQLV